MLATSLGHAGKVGMNGRKIGSAKCKTDHVGDRSLIRESKYEVRSSSLHFLEDGP